MARIRTTTSGRTLRNIDTFLHETRVILTVIQRRKFFVAHRGGELIRQPEWLALRHFTDVLDARRLNRKKHGRAYAEFVFGCIDWALQSFPDWKNDMHSLVRHLEYLLNRKSEGVYMYQSALELFLLRLRNKLRERLANARVRQRALRLRPAA